VKLDRNINPDGRGKYALINLRTNTVCWGGNDQFFVIKYKDAFASQALYAYAEAANNKALQLESMSRDTTLRRAKAKELKKQAESLREWALEIFREAETARSYPNQKIPD
jgi:hypothetical protein